MNTIRLIALVLAALGAALLGQGQHTALADGEYGTLYIDVQPDANNTTEGFGNIEVCTDREDIGDGSGDDGLLEVGERFSIDVVIEGAPPATWQIAGAQYTLNYNPAVLKVTDQDWASWKLGPGMGAWDTLPDSDGQFNTAWTGSGVAGDGVVTRITLEALADGTSDLYFSYEEGWDGTPILYDEIANPYYPPEVLVDDPPGNVRVVVGGFCPAATPTPPPAVGGIAELPDVGDSAARNHMALAGLAAVALAALSAGTWYARRRWLG